MVEGEGWFIWKTGGMSCGCGVRAGEGLEGSHRAFSECHSRWRTWDRAVPLDAIALDMRLSKNRE